MIISITVKERVMTEKKAIVKEEAKKFVLPKPDFPDLKPPVPPKSDMPQGQPHMSCEGDIYVTPKENPNILPPKDGMPRVMIGVPILTYSHDFVQCFLKFWSDLCLMAEGKFQAGYHFMHRKPVHMAEESLVDVAKYNKCTHILFIDDDITGYTLKDLQLLLDAKKEVIGGVMHASKFPYAMCVFRRYNVEKKVIDMPSDNSMFRLYEVPCACPNPQCNFRLSHWDAKFCPVCGATCDNMIQKADLIPFCFTLMKLSIFDKIKPPAFYCSNKYPTDSWFADKCREVGIQQYAHMGIRLTHDGVNDINKPYLIQMKIEEKKRTDNRGIVNISEEEMAKHEFILDNRMKEAEVKCKTSLDIVLPKEDRNVSKTKSINNGVTEKAGIKVSG